MKNFRIYRLQHIIDGRGPFRSGLTQKWQAKEGPELPPPPWIEANITITHYLALFTPGMHRGTGCKSYEQIDEWFNSEERLKLSILGFILVEFAPDIIILDLPHQVVFECFRPLKEYGKYQVGKLEGMEL